MLKIVFLVEALKSSLSNHYLPSQDFWPSQTRQDPKLNCLLPKENSVWPQSVDLDLPGCSPQPVARVSHVHLTALQWPSASFLPRQEPAVSKTPALQEASQPGIVAIGAGSSFLPCSGSLSSIALPPTVYIVGMLVPGSGASETRRPQYTQAG